VWSARWFVRRVCRVGHRRLIVSDVAVVIGPHRNGCPCTRCVGFEPGNEVALKHGSYVSPLRLTSRVGEIAEALLENMPHRSPVFAAMVQAAALAGARLERAIAALEDAKPGELARLEQDARGWHRSWVSALNALGLTPLSASRMGLNIALAGGSVRSRLADRYREQGEAAS